MSILDEKVNELYKKIQKYSETLQKKTGKFAESIVKVLREHAYDELPEIFTLLEVEKKMTPMPVCHKLIKDGEKRVKCLSCGLPGTFVCRECFDRGDHEEHQFELLDKGVTYCCCGDSEKWKITCSQHVPRKSNNIEAKQQRIFTQNIKFGFHIFLELLNLCQELHPAPEFFVNTCKVYLKQFLLWIIRFNYHSTISNELTFNSFMQPYHELYYSSFKYAKKPIMEIIFTMDTSRVRETFQNFLAILIGLLNVEGCKIALLKYFLKYYYLSEYLVENPIANIAGQILTCPTTINKGLEKNQINHFLYKPGKNTDVQRLNRNYLQFYDHFACLLSMEDGASDFLLNQFLYGNVSLFCSYVPYFNNKIQQASIFYSVQEKYLKTLAASLKLLISHPLTLAKMSRDCLRQSYEVRQNNLFLGFQRSLALCLFAYGGCDSEKVLNLPMLKYLALSPFTFNEEMNHLLKTMAATFKIYCLCIADSKDAQNYIHFKKQTLDKKAPILLAADMYMFKFIFCMFRRYSDIDLIPLFRPFFLQITSIFKQSHRIFIDRQDANKARKEALSKFTAFLSFIIQIATSDHFLATIGAQIGYISKDQMEHFYGGLLSSVQPIGLAEFRSLLSQFVKDDPIFLDQFIEENTHVEEGKLELNAESRRNKKYESYCLDYFITKKLGDQLPELTQINQMRIQINSFPNCYNGDYDLGIFMFPDDSLTMIAEVAFQFLNFFEDNEKILERDYSQFSLYLQKLLMIRFLHRFDCELDLVFDRLMSTPGLSQKVNEKLKRGVEILKRRNNEQFCLGDFFHHRIKFDLKKKTKFEKFNRKRKNFEKNKPAIQSQQKQKQKQKEKKNQEPSKCVVCGVKKKSPLTLMCYLQKSNAFTSEYLKIDRDYYIITTCSHPIHHSCYEEFKTEQGDYICQYCTAGSNLLVPIINESGEQFKMNYFLQSQLKNVLKEVPIKEKKKNKNEQFTFMERIIESLAYSLLYGVMADPEFYENNIIQIHYYIIHYLKTKRVNCRVIREFLFSQMVGHEQEEESKFWVCLGFVYESLISIMEYKKQPGEAKQNEEQLLWWKKKFDHMPPQFKRGINLVLERLKLSQFQTYQREHMGNAVSPLNFVILPPKLNSLTYEYLGRCPQCQHMSNEICICFLCGFRSCIGCQAFPLRKHQMNKHIWGAIFVRIDSGKTIYVTEKKAWVCESIYQNMFQDPYTEGKNRDKYKQDLNQYQQVKKNVIKHKIYDTIRYKQLFEDESNSIEP